MTRWVVGALLALAVFASGWLARELESSAAPRRPEGREADFFMTDFVSVAMDARGVRERELRASRLVHFADSGTQELTAPRLCFGLDEPSPWCVVSDRGWVSADQDTVRLLGEVHLWQQDGGGASLLDVYTREVTVHIPTKQAETAESARIVGRWGEATGVGMVARLADQRLQLLSEVKTRYETTNR